MRPTSRPGVSTEFEAGVPNPDVGRHWAIAAGALAAALGALALIYLLARPLALLVAAITLAEALSPLAKRLSRWMPHALASVIVFVGLLALGTIGLLIPVPALASEAQSLVEKLPDLLSRLQSWVAWGNQVANVDLQQMLADRGKALVSGLVIDSPAKALMAAAAYVAIQQFEGQALTPNMMTAQTRLSPVIVILALLSGAALGGFLGALVAVPIAGALRVLLRHLAMPALKRSLAATRRPAAVVVTTSE